MTNKVGSPRKLFDKKTQDRFLEAIRNGAKLRQGCGYAGISYAALRRFILIGQEHDDINSNNSPDEYIQFLRKYELARSERAMRWAKIIESAAPKNWQAAAWLLERCEPDDYSLKSVGDDASNTDNNTADHSESTTDDLVGSITKLLDTARERAVKTQS